MCKRHVETLAKASTFVIAGHYLRIHPSTLVALTRSGEEASTSRSRKSDFDVTIREEEGHVTCSRQS